MNEKKKTINIPEPQKSNYVTDKIKPDNPVRSYKNFDERSFMCFLPDADISLTDEGEIIMDGDTPIRAAYKYIQINKDAIDKNFINMNNDFSLL